MRAAAWCLVVGALAALEQENRFVIKGSGVIAHEKGLEAAAEGRYADALPLLEQVVGAEAEAAMGTARVAVARNALGGAYKALGRPDEARAAFDTALTAFRALASGPLPMTADAAAAHVEAAVVQNNLGSVLADLGRPAEARQLYEGALAVFGARGGPHYDDARRADPLNNLADLHHSSGRAQCARPVTFSLLTPRA